MFITEDPLESLPILIKEISEFGDLAGFYLNKSKSKILCKNVGKTKEEKISEITGCEVAKKVKYLGIEITSKNIDLFKNNYEKLWPKIKQDLLKWNKLNLSLLGRIAVLKMNVLPRISFLFQMIPVVKGNKHFDRWQKDLNEFVWAGRKPRVKWKVMCDAVERGGQRLGRRKGLPSSCERQARVLETERKLCPSK